MKSENVKLDTSSIKSFVSENKIIIAALGGITVGLALASLFGNEKAREVLRSVGSKLSEFSGYKELIEPLFAKTDVQGI